MATNGVDLPTVKSQTQTALPKEQLKEPSLYKVILHNDDFTPMDFVVWVLQSIFQKDHTRAVQMMLEIHNQGASICGVYPLEIAETKMTLVHEAAAQKEYPLKCSMEKS